MSNPTVRTAKRIYPEPPDVGIPPDEVHAWTERVIASWSLTPREREVCEALLKGLTTREMTAMIGSTEKTLKHHIATIFGKAHVSSRSELFSEILRR